MTEKRKKRLFWRIILAIPVVIIIALVGVYVARNALVKAAIEEGGEYAMGVKTSVGSVDVNIRGGSFAMDNFSVANPQGYESKSFLALGEGRIELETGSVLDNQVVIPLFSLSNLSVNIEQTLEGANYRTILNNLSRFESKESDTKSERGLAFKEILIKNVDVSASLKPPAGNTITRSLHIDEIRLTNVGTKDKGGASIAETVAIVVKAVLQRVASSGNILPGDIINGMKGSLADVGNFGITGVDVESGGIQGAAESVLDKAKEAGKDVGGTLKDLGSGLLGGKKDKSDSTK